jgi:uncharacterized damage-inducible protein DinB
MLLSLYEYNFAMNQRLIGRIFNGNSLQKNIALFSHILNAQNIWNSRILNQKPSFEVFQVHQPKEFENINQELHHTSYFILNNIPLNSQISYINSQQQRFSNTVEDILIHVVNHATYHRAQIAQHMRLNNLEPVATDYISFKRKSF